MDARPRRAIFSAILIILIGSVFAVGGIDLALLHGSIYYLLTGLGLVVAGILLLQGRAASLVVYACLLLGSLAWCLWEAGLDRWQLEARLLSPMIVGLWLWAPWIANRLVGGGGNRGPSAGDIRLDRLLLGGSIFVVASTLAFSFLNPEGIRGIAAAAPKADAGADASDWPFYGRTPRGERFSPLDQITPKNVRNLKLAWIARTGDTKSTGIDAGRADLKNEFNFEATPIKIGDTLYVCTGHSWVIAIDAETGRTKWTFDPHADTRHAAIQACRGVAFYKAPENRSAVCPRRIIAPVLDARLMALNADTGRPCEDFGEHGFVSLKRDLGVVSDGFYSETSPPLVLNDRVLVGGYVYENQTIDQPSGAIRAFDPVTGSLSWAWDIGSREPGIRPDAPGSLTRGTPNAWGVITADPELGLAYVPLASAAPDYFGGARSKTDDEYANSIVALDIQTGQQRWHYQTVHHDLWDLDLPIGPTLVDLADDKGQVVPALVQSTKRGEFFVLDRRSGKPLAEVEERPVPTDGVPGETLSPTQPFSIGMPSLAPADLTEAQMWGATPLDQMLCRIMFRSATYKGQFTPIGERPTIGLPAFYGVMDWQGATIDPERKLLVANASYLPFVLTLHPRGSEIARSLMRSMDSEAVSRPPSFARRLADWARATMRSVLRPGELAFPQKGTPYVATVRPWVNALRVPCNSPPWGTLTAIDLTKRVIVWQRTLGTTRDTGLLKTKINLPLPTGIFSLGGSVITRGGVIFIAGTADAYLRAFDASNGDELWSERLPAGGQATPMSYSQGGKQYIVIAAGGHGALQTKLGDYVLAYSLP